MAGQQGGGFLPPSLKIAFFAGLSTLAGILGWQRVTRVKMQQHNIECKEIPAGERIEHALDSWKKEAKAMPNVDLMSSATGGNGVEPTVDFKTISIPTLIKCKDGTIWACVNSVPRVHGAPNLVELPAALANKNLYKKLNFSAQGDKRVRRQVKTILNQEIINNLTALGHIHVSKAHASLDTGMDNRVFIAKKDNGHGHVPDYYVCGQDNVDGVYKYKAITQDQATAIGIGDLSDFAYEQKKEGMQGGLGKIKKLFAGPQDPIKLNALVNFARTNDGIPLAAGENHFDVRGYDRRLDAHGYVDPTGRAAGQARTMTDEERDSFDATNKQNLMLFSGALGATQAMSLVQQAKQSLTYSLMNKMGHGQQAPGSAPTRGGAPVPVPVAAGAPGRP